MIDVSAVRLVSMAVIGWLDRRERDAVACLLVTCDTLFVLDLASRRVQVWGSPPHPNATFMQYE